MFGCFSSTFQTTRRRFSVVFGKFFNRFFGATFRAFSKPAKRRFAKPIQLFALILASELLNIRAARATGITVIAVTHAAGFIFISVEGFERLFKLTMFADFSFH
jgi:hypothetical protein